MRHAAWSKGRWTSSSPYYYLLSLEVLIVAVFCTETCGGNTGKGTRWRHEVARCASACRVGSWRRVPVPVRLSENHLEFPKSKWWHFYVETPNSHMYTTRVIKAMLHVTFTYSAWLSSLQGTFKNGGITLSGRLLVAVHGGGATRASFIWGRVVVCYHVCVSYHLSSHPSLSMYLLSIILYCVRISALSREPEGLHLASSCAAREEHKRWWEMP